MGRVHVLLLAQVSRGSCFGAPGLARAGFAVSANQLAIAQDIYIF
jgi:hypothetical protein